MSLFKTSSHSSQHQAGVCLSIFLLLTLGFTSVSGEQTTSLEANSRDDDTSIQTKYPVSMAQQSLEYAKQNYKQGDIESVKKKLQEAKKWLVDSQSSENAKSNMEAIKLANEITKLEKQLNGTTYQNESMLSRLWHRSTALVEHELQLVKKHWNEASSASESYKYILDARLHFDYAEHELFVSHDNANAEEEIKLTLNYLEQAKIVANPSAINKIDQIQKEIGTLNNFQPDQAEKQKLSVLLESAAESLQQARKSTGPLMDSELENISRQIATLKNNLGNLLSREKHQIIMGKLTQLDKDL